MSSDLRKKETLYTALQSRITRKDQADNVKGGPYRRYILVIFTDELFLNRNDVESFIAGTPRRPELVPFNLALA